MNPYPIVTTIAIITLIVLVGAIAAYIRDRKKYAGHEAYARDAAKLAKDLGGEVFRDGTDLVINGSRDGKTVVIRLSYAENTPGLNLRMNAPANFSLTTVPRGVRGSHEGRTPVRTPDDNFEARFSTRSDHPLVAKMFLDGKRVMPELAKLCCSKAFFSISSGMIEQSEPMIPMPNTGRHIMEHLDSMAALSRELERMPSAEKVAVPVLKKDRHIVLKLALVVGVIAAAVGIITAARQPEEPPLPKVGPDAQMAAGLTPVEANAISGLEGWHLVAPKDLDGDAVAWVNGFGQKDLGRVPGTYMGKSAQPDLAYLFVNDAGKRRLVIVADGHVLYDVMYDYIGILARVPKSSIAAIQWTTRTPETPDGDALLITKKAQDRTSGVVMYFSDGRLVSGVPSDYQSINLTE